MIAIACETVPAVMIATDLPRREFLQAANDYIPGKHNVAGWYISEKLDGLAAFWDGGISRGRPTISVPWAGLYNGPRHKTSPGLLKKKITPIATGLWSRAGNPIIAPDWFLDLLPTEITLVGELWAGRNKFQETISICTQDVPDERWRNIRYAVYSSPSAYDVFTTGEIKNGQMWRAIVCEECIQWSIEAILGPGAISYPNSDPPRTFADEYELLLDRYIFTNSDANTIFLHEQTKLVNSERFVTSMIEQVLQEVLAKGGEGVILRDPQSVWKPKRHSGILKYKPEHDAEATIVGFTAGEQGVTGNMTGKIGALKVVWNHKGYPVEFKIGTGLTMEQREFADSFSEQLATQSPGQDLPPYVDGKHIHRGETITFKYREVTNDGVPKEARYFRKRVEE